MTITALTDPSKLPNQSQEQSVFDANVAYLVENLPERARQENELAAMMSAYAAGGAYAFEYTFDSATTDSDPGTGKLRLNSATQNAATGIRIDNAMVGGTDLSAIWADLLSVTSGVKGSLRMVKVGDPTKWMVLDITSGTSPSGYRNLVATVRASSSANPFALDDALMVHLQRTGDKGEDSAVLPTIRVRQEVTSGTGGGSSTAGTLHTRILNTVATNTITGASLASNAVTLPAGTYKVRASAPASGSATSVKHQARVVVNNGVTILGTSESTGSSLNTQSLIEGEFIATGTVNVTLRHYISASQAGYGQGVSVGDTTEIYAQMTIEKIA